LFALILLIVIPITVGSVIEAKEAAISGMNTKLDGKKGPKTQGQISAMGEQTKLLGGRLVTLHSEMHHRQQDLLTFPPELTGLNKLEFGAPILERDRTTYIQEACYAREYEEMAAIIKPTEFVGGWRSILLPVSWSTTLFPQPEEVWLSLEDMCVRREMLHILHDANMSIATFTPVGPEPKFGALPFSR